jgi:membrane protein required for beta-lactamase induction
MKDKPIPDRTFILSLSEAELVLLTTALLRLEHWQILIAKSEQLKGLDRQSHARRQTSAKCLALVDRLENIGAEQGARE